VAASRRVLVLVVIAVAAAAGVLSWIGWQLSRPVPRRIGAPPPHLNATAVAFRSESGSLIHGWLSIPDTPRGSVLLLPPVRANRTAMVPRAKFLAGAEYATLLVDLQATGESPGDAITFGWRERLDVLASVRFLKEHVPEQPVAVIGWSLGGAAALLATPPLDVQAMVLEAVYPSIDRAIENRLRMRLGSAGIFVSPLLLWQLGPRLGVPAEQLRPVDHIGRLRCPVLVIGGAEDRHTTEADTRLLFDAARPPKQLWLISAAAHVDFYDTARGEYQRRVLEFIRAALPPTPEHD